MTAPTFQQDSPHLIQHAKKEKALLPTAHLDKNTYHIFTGISPLKYSIKEYKKTLA